MLRSSAFRVLVASTPDISDEREQLRRYCIPEIRKMAFNFGQHMTWIDIRQGISNASNAEVAVAALLEAARCSFFIGLAGSKCGDPCSDLDAVELNSLTSAIPWILKIPNIQEKSLFELLVKVAVLVESSEASFSSPSKSHHHHLNNNNNTPGSLFFFQQPHTLDRTLEHLKDSVSAFGLAMFISCSLDQMLAFSIQEVKHYLSYTYAGCDSSVNLLSETRKVHTSLSEAKMEHFLDPEHLITELGVAVEAGGGPIIVSGQHGVGKASLVANYLKTQSCRKWTFVHHCGANSQSKRLTHLLWRLSYEIGQSFGTTRHVGVSESELISLLPITIADIQGPAIIAILGADFIDGNVGKSLEWIPETLPANVTFIVTASNGEALIVKTAQARRWRQFNVVEMNASEDQGKLLHSYLNTFKSKNKLEISRLQSIVTENPNGYSPLSLKLATFASSDLVTFQTLLQKASTCVADLCDFVVQVLASGSNGQEISSILSCLNASNSGLTEEELSNVAGVPWYRLTRILNELSKAVICQCGKDGTFHFSHRVISDAIVRKYHAEIGRSKVHLAAYFEQLYPFMNMRTIVELPFQLAEIGARDRLLLFLSDSHAPHAFIKENLVRIFIAVWGAAGGAGVAHEHYEKTLQAMLRSSNVSPCDLCNFSVAVSKILQLMNDIPNAISLLKLVKPIILSHHVPHSKISSMNIPADSKDEWRGIFGKFSEVRSDIRHVLSLLSSPRNSPTRQVSSPSSLLNNSNSSSAAAAANNSSNIGSDYTKTSVVPSQSAANVCLELGKLLRIQGNNEEALGVLREGMSAINHLRYLPNVRIDQTLSSIFVQAAKCFEAMGQYEEAVEHFSEAIGNLLGQGPQEGAQAVNVMVMLGELHLHHNNNTQAVAILQQALASQISFQGEKHPDVASTHLLLGQTFQNSNDFTSAWNHVEIAVKIFQSSLGSETASTANALYHLAKLAHQMAKFTTAIELHNEALRIRLKCLGENHCDFWASLMGLAAAQGAGSNPTGLTNAIYHVQRALTLIQKNSATKSKQLCEALELLGDLQNKVGDKPLSLNMLRKAAEVAIITSPTSATRLHRKIAALNKSIDPSAANSSSSTLPNNSELFQIIFLGSGSNPLLPSIRGLVDKNCTLTADALRKDTRSPNLRRSLSIVIRHSIDSLMPVRNVLVAAPRSLRESTLEWFNVHDIRSIDAIIVPNGSVDSFAGISDLEDFVTTQIPVFCPASEADFVRSWIEKSCKNAKKKFHVVALEESRKRFEPVVGVEMSILWSLNDENCSMGLHFGDICLVPFVDLSSGKINSPMRDVVNQSSIVVARANTSSPNLFSSALHLCQLGFNPSLVHPNNASSSPLTHLVVVGVGAVDHHLAQSQLEQACHTLAIQGSVAKDGMSITWPETSSSTQSTSSSATQQQIESEDAASKRRLSALEINLKDLQKDLAEAQKERARANSLVTSHIDNMTGNGDENNTEELRRSRSDTTTTRSRTRRPSYSDIVVSVPFGNNTAAAAASSLDRKQELQNRLGQRRVQRRMSLGLLPSQLDKQENDSGDDAKSSLSASGQQIRATMSSIQEAKMKISTIVEDHAIEAEKSLKILAESAKQRELQALEREKAAKEAEEAAKQRQIELEQLLLHIQSERQKATEESKVIREKMKEDLNKLIEERVPSQQLSFHSSSNKSNNKTSDDAVLLSSSTSSSSNRSGFLPPRNRSYTVSALSSSSASSSSFDGSVDRRQQLRQQISERANDRLKAFGIQKEDIKNQASAVVAAAISADGETLTRASEQAKAELMNMVEEREEKEREEKEKQEKEKQEKEKQEKEKQEKVERSIESLIQSSLKEEEEDDEEEEEPTKTEEEKTIKTEEEPTKTEEEKTIKTEEEPTKTEEEATTISAPQLHAIEEDLIPIDVPLNTSEEDQESTTTTTAAAATVQPSDDEADAVRSRRPSYFKESISDPIIASSRDERRDRLKARVTAARGNR